MHVKPAILSFIIFDSKYFLSLNTPTIPKPLWAMTASEVSRSGVSPLEGCGSNVAFVTSSLRDLHNSVREVA